MSRLQYPVDARTDRDTERKGYQQHEAGEHRHRRATQSVSCSDALCEWPRAAHATTASCQSLAREHEQAEEDEHERERRGGRYVEGDVELGEDLGGERLVAEDLKRAVLGEQHERDEQAAAEDRSAGLSEGDPPERAAGVPRRGCARPPPGRGRRCGSSRRPADIRVGKPRASSRAPRRGTPAPMCSAMPSQSSPRSPGSPAAPPRARPILSGLAGRSARSATPPRSRSPHTGTSPPRSISPCSTTGSPSTGGRSAHDRRDARAVGLDQQKAQRRHQYEGNRQAEREEHPGRASTAGRDDPAVVCGRGGLSLTAGAGAMLTRDCSV